MPYQEMCPDGLKNCERPIINLKDQSNLQLTKGEFVTRNSTHDQAV